MTTIKAEIKQIYTPLAEIDKALIEQYKREKIYAHELEIRLLEWGRWLAKCLDNGIGFPARSITVAALEGSPSTTPKYPPENAAAEVVNGAFLHMRVLHSQWADVLETEYVRNNLDIEAEDGKTRVTKQEDRAKKLGITFSNYRQYLRSAKSFIEGHIIR